MGQPKDETSAELAKEQTKQATEASKVGTQKATGTLGEGVRHAAETLTHAAATAVGYTKDAVRSLTSTSEESNQQAVNSAENVSVVVSIVSTSFPLLILFWIPWLKYFPHMIMTLQAKIAAKQGTKEAGEELKTSGQTAKKEATIHGRAASENAQAAALNAMDAFE